MTIYGVGYRALQYRPEPVWKRLQAIASIEFRSLFRSRWGVALFFLCLAPSLVSLFVMLGYMRVLQLGDMPGIERLTEQVQNLPANANAEMLRFMPWQLHFYLVPIITESVAPFLILTALVSSRAIAKDRAVNAMELSWTRGISPRGYFLAKWFGSGGLLLQIGVGGSLLVWIIGVFLAPDWAFLEQTWAFMPRTLLALLLFTALMSYLPVALSAVAATPNMGSIMWVMLIMASTAAGHVLGRGMRDESWVTVISVWDAASTVASAIAGLREKPDTLRNAVANLAVVTSVLSVLMLRRMRLREAIG